MVKRTALFLTPWQNRHIANGDCRRKRKQVKEVFHKRDDKIKCFSARQIKNIKKFNIPTNFFLIILKKKSGNKTTRNLRRKKRDLKFPNNARQQLIQIWDDELMTFKNCFYVLKKTGQTFDFAFVFCLPSF